MQNGPYIVRISDQDDCEVDTTDFEYLDEAINYVKKGVTSSINQKEDIEVYTLYKRIDLNFSLDVSVED